MLSLSDKTRQMLLKVQFYFNLDSKEQKQKINLDSYIDNPYFKQIALLVCPRSSSPLSQPSKYVSKQLAVYKVVKTCIFYPRT